MGVKLRALPRVISIFLKVEIIRDLCKFRVKLCVKSIDTSTQEIQKSTIALA